MSNTHVESKSDNKMIYTGMLFAFIAVVIWSGNFIVARGISSQVPPIYINFFRWFTASLVIIPFGYKKFRAEQGIVKTNIGYFLAITISGIIIYNNLLYLAGHYTSAINLAMLGTTSTSIFSIILASIFLKEKNTPLRILGLLISIFGVVLLLTKGSLAALVHFHFSSGDLIMIFCSVFFAAYTVGVRKKPAGTSPIVFLFVMFWMGTFLLLPMVITESFYYPPVQWDFNKVAIFLYLGVGTSFIAYICWNGAIERIGSSRTALFGNLVPVLSTIEATLILHEKLLPLHLISLVMVICGLVIANLPLKPR